MNPWGTYHFQFIQFPVAITDSVSPLNQWVREKKRTLLTLHLPRTRPFFSSFRSSSGGVQKMCCACRWLFWIGMHRVNWARGEFCTIWRVPCIPCNFCKTYADYGHNPRVEMQALQYTMCACIVWDRYILYGLWICCTSMDPCFICVYGIRLYFGYSTTVLHKIYSHNPWTRIGNHGIGELSSRVCVTFNVCLLTCRL